MPDKRNDIQAAVATVRSAIAAWPAEPLTHNISRKTILALAWIEEVHAHWDGVADLPEYRDAAALAVKMAQAATADMGDGMERNIVMGRAGPPIYFTIRQQGPRDPWVSPDKYVCCLQSMMGDAKPLWALYLPMARDQLELEKAAAAESGFGQ